MKQKLNAKDFILIGVLTALMWIICMIISTIMSVAGPVTNVFYPSVVAIPNGIVMMLLLAKVPKKGVFTICSAIQAILFLLVGAFWFIPIGLVIGGVICDFLVMGRKIADHAADHQADGDKPESAHQQEQDSLDCGADGEHALFRYLSQ